MHACVCACRRTYMHVGMAHACNVHACMCAMHMQVVCMHACAHCLRPLPTTRARAAATQACAAAATATPQHPPSHVLHAVAAYTCMHAHTAANTHTHTQRHTDTHTAHAQHITHIQHTYAHTYPQLALVVRGRVQNSCAVSVVVSGLLAVATILRGPSLLPTTRSTLSSIPAYTAHQHEHTS